MAKRGWGKKRIRVAPKRSDRREHPTPVQAIEWRHTKQAQILAARDDRFSRLLSRLLKDERRGQHVLTRSGLTKEDHAELESLAPEAHAALEIEMHEAIERLRGVLAVGDPLYITAILLMPNVFGGWGTYFEPTSEGGEHKVELVAGLLATQPVSKKLDGPADAEMQQIHDEIEHILAATFLFNLSMPRGDDHDIAALRFMGTMNWMLLRGSSYGHHGRDLAQALYGPHDEWMLAKYGFMVGDVLQLGERVESLMNERVNDLMNQARQFSDEVRKYVRSEGGKERLPAEAREQMSTEQGEFQLSAAALVEVFQSGIRQATTFSVDELCAANEGLRRDRVEAALRELSIAVGALESSAYTGPFDKSPLIDRPFLEFNGRYLLAIPGMVLRDTVALLEDRFMTGKANFSRARAKTLDGLAVRHLSDMLPGSMPYTNLFYEGAELDGLVLLEDIAFAVEGKGTGLSVQAHRGDVKRLQRDIGKAVEDAWKQGARAREFILREGDSVFKDEKGNELVRIQAGSVSEVIIVNPTLHDLGGHAPQLARLRALGLFPEGELPWSVYINDLRVISETCDNAAVFLHYLVWRNRLPLGERMTVVDEIDLWGSYLLSERFGMLAEGGQTIVGNSSTDFDGYYDGLLGHGPKRKPPGKFLREPVKAFVERMASVRRRGWRQAAGACLDLSIPELGFVCGKAQEIALRATAEGQPLFLELGRVALVGVPRTADVATVVREFHAYGPDPTLLIYCAEATPKRVEIVWAKYAKPVTFELSDFEKAVFDAPETSPFRLAAGPERR
jgi:hypothetical protein